MKRVTVYLKDAGSEVYDRGDGPDPVYIDPRDGTLHITKSDGCRVGYAAGEWWKWEESESVSEGKEALRVANELKRTQW